MMALVDIASDVWMRDVAIRFSRSWETRERSWRSTIRPTT